MNNPKAIRMTVLATAIAAACSWATAQEITLYESHTLPDALVFEPRDARGMEASIDMIVSGPNDFYLRKSFEAGQPIELAPEDLAVGGMPDGTYQYELRIMGITGLKADRDSGKPALAEPMQGGSGAFSILDGRIVTQELSETPYKGPDAGTRIQGASRQTTAAAKEEDSTRDQVIVDDLIVDGSLCVGLDCVNGENFGFDTIRMKENNTRIKFDDTSTSGSFPNNDWQLTANDSANGGLNKFSIENTTAGRIPFTVEGSAPTNSLWIDDTGRIGFGTSTPVVENHIVDGDSPTVRLEQDGSSGFTPQIWDVAGNETNFFIRDVTNASRLPFKIRPGAATNSLVIDSEGQIAIGGANADDPLHIQQSTGAEANAIKLSNDSSSVIWFENTGLEQSWKVSNNTNAFRISLAGSGGPEFEVDNDGTVRMGPGTGAVFALDPSGNLTISGSLTANGSTFPDYVFEDDYKLLDIHEVKSYIEDFGRLPNVPSAEEIERDGLDMTKMQKKMMEKIEELTLYTIHQQERIETLEAELAALR